MSAQSESSAKKASLLDAERGHNVAEAYADAERYEVSLRTLLGAIEAVEEIWQLTSVVKWPRMLGVGAVVDFLFRAGRKRGCMRLMPL